MSQTQFAGLGGVSKRAQINYEQGDSTPDASYLASIEKVGADVLYIVTGARMANRLEPMEQLFLERFRGAPKALQDSALLALMGQSGQFSSAKQIAEAMDDPLMKHAGTVSAKFNVQGNVDNQFENNHGNINIDKRGK